MRKFFVLSILCLAVPAMARDIYRSSTTATADTTQVLCGSGRRGYLYSVCVSSAVSGTGTTIYNSSFTTSGVANTGFISNGTVGCVAYQTVYPKGLLYTKTGVANINIAYDCF